MTIAIATTVASARAATSEGAVEESIRNLVRLEVRAEVTRALAAQSTSPQLVSAAAYAKARSISISTVRNAIRTGRLPAVRIGTAVRVRTDAEIGHAVVAARPTASPALRAEQILLARANRKTRRLACTG